MKRFETYLEAFKDERQNTIQYMRKYGMRKIRGADALNCRDDCYTPQSLCFWIPAELRKEALAGKLGKVDYCYQSDG